MRSKMLEQRRHEREGEHPAEQHADAADEAEVPETPVRRQDEHGERHAGGRRRRAGWRAPPRARLEAGGLERHAGPPELPHPRQVDEPVVDAVADDDAAEERRLRVEVADDQPGEPEGEQPPPSARRCPARPCERRSRKKRKSESSTSAHHQHHGGEHVVEDGLVARRRRGGSCPPKPDAQVAGRELGLVTVDHGAHAVEQLRASPTLDRRARGAHHEGEGGAVRVDEEAVLVAGEAVLAPSARGSGCLGSSQGASFSRAGRRGCSSGAGLASSRSRSNGSASSARRSRVSSAFCRSAVEAKSGQWSAK